MMERRKLLAVLALAMLLVASKAMAADLICHIHLSADHPLADGKPRIIWNVGDKQTCVARNAQVYQSKGRCHCSFSTRPGRGSPAVPMVPDGPPAGLL